MPYLNYLDTEEEDFPAIGLPRPIPAIPRRVPEDVMPEPQPGPSWLRQPTPEAPPEMIATQQSRDALNRVIAARPEHKSRWWDKLIDVGKAAAGGLAGWSNASGTRAPYIDPAAVGQSIDAIAHPKFNQQMRDWNKNLNVAQNRMEMDKQNLSDWLNTRKSQADVDKTAADVAEARARARLYGAQADDLSDASRKDYVPVPGGGLWDARNQKWIREPIDKTQLIEVDGAWAKKNAPFLKPDAEGHYYVPTTAASTIIRTENPTLIPGRDTPLSPEVEEQRKRIARESRPPREPSASEQKRKETETIRALANRAMQESRLKGGTEFDDAIRNVQQFYPDDPEMNEYRESVIEQLNRWKVAGLRPDQIEAQIANGGGWMTAPQTPPPQPTGGRGGQPAQPKVRVYNPKTGKLE